MEDIILASRNSDIEGIKSALKRDPACINAVDTQNGMTPLHWAICGGDEDIVRFLCEQPDIALDICDGAGRPPYFLAMAVLRPDLAQEISAAAEKAHTVWGGGNRLRQALANPDSKAPKPSEP